MDTLMLTVGDVVVFVDRTRLLEELFNKMNALYNDPMTSQQYLAEILEKEEFVSLDKVFKTFTSVLEMTLLKQHSKETPAVILGSFELFVMKKMLEGFLIGLAPRTFGVEGLTMVVGCKDAQDIEVLAKKVADIVFEPEELNELSELLGRFKEVLKHAKVQ